MDYLRDHIIVPIFVGIVVLVVGYLLIQRRNERWQRRLPARKALSNLLGQVEKEIEYFTDKKTTNTLRSNIIIHSGTYKSGDVVINDGDEVFLNANSCGGPLSWKGVSELLGDTETFVKERFTPDVGLGREKGNLVKINVSLENFISRLKAFNKEWPSFPPGPSVKELERQNGKSPFEETAAIESEADLIKEEIIEFKNEVDKAIER